MFSFILNFDIAEVIEEKEIVKTPELGTLEGKKILIVEDNRINQIVTRKILEKDRVICSIAENGEIAVEMVKKEKFDFILMDINMPVKNGIDATREIRTFNTTIPIVALTAVEIEEMSHQIFDSGMNDIIVKPYDVTRFVQTILKNMDANGLTKKSLDPASSLKAV